MESRGFHICPFCQAQCPVTASRCVRCHRALSGLPLPVYGADLDAEMRPDAGADLVDLPLRETTTEAPHPEVARAAVPGVPAATAPVRRPVPRRQPHTHDGGRGLQPQTHEGGRGLRARRTARLAVAAGLLGAGGLLAAATLVGSWLVRAQGREAPPAAEVVPATAPPVTAPPATAPPVTAPRVTASVPPRPRPAAPLAAERATAPPVSEVARDQAPVPRPRRPPAAEVIEPPDVAAAPVDVERARDDLGRDDSPGTDAGARAALRARLDRAEERRDVAAERVRELRARLNVPVIRDVDEYQRLQAQLAAALDDLDQASVEVQRFRRALRRRAE